MKLFQHFPRASWLALPLTLTLACTGEIGVGRKPGAGGANPPGVDDPVSPPAVPPPAMPLPDTAPLSGPIASAPGPSSRLLRLSHRQWENTVRDLLRLTDLPGLSKQFVNEGTRSTFDNQGGELEVSSKLWVDYNKAAGTLATQVVRDSKTLGGIMPSDAGTGDSEARARSFIRGFGTRAYRRPLTDAEVDQYLGMYRQGPMLIGSGDSFLDGIEMVVATFLQSPHFLYRAELGTEVKNGRVTLTDFEIASRLSYGLVGTMPDDRMLADAKDGKLHARNEVLAHAKRLIDSPAGKSAIRDLHDQLMRASDPSELIRDVKIHANFKPGIGVDMKNEALAFVDEVIFARNLGVAELLTASYTFVNSRTAPIYGVKVPAGDELVKVDLDPNQRAGIYTQLGYLAITANDSNPRPIKRGVSISEHVLCQEVPAPPPDAAETEAPRTEGKSNRQAFEAITEAPGTICAGCHQRFINPIGFAFEAYDGMGGIRTQDQGRPIDAKGSYEFPEGRRDFDGAVALMKIIAEGKQAHECYAKNLFSYLYGREKSAFEAGLITEIGRRSRLKVPVKDLVLEMVATEAFLTRAP